MKFNEISNLNFFFRSGLAVKNGIDVGAGVVDYDYRGNVGVVLFNHLDEDLNVKKGDRIAQLVLEKIFMPELIAVTVRKKLRKMSFVVKLLAYLITSILRSEVF